jgi:uncharacterized protein with FMN-binding domain
MKKKHVIILIVFIVLIGAVFAVSRIISSIDANLEHLSDTRISDVDLSKIADGTYAGSYKQFPISAEVKVTVKDHIITEIDLVKHDSGQGKPAEIILGKVVETQSLQVDAVTGATYSSMVILKAVENALLNAVR